MKNLIIASLLVMAIFLQNCGESVDPMKADIKLEMKATTQQFSINPNARVAASGIEFTEVLIGVTEIELESLEGNHDDEDDNSGHDSDDGNDNDSDNDADDDSDDGDDDDDEYEIEFEGQFIVDLLKGTSDPDFGIADVVPGNYKELEVKISPILDDGNSVYIKFNYTQEGMDPIIVEISTDKEFEFEIENHAGIQLDGNALNQILVLFDLDQLLSGIDLSNLNLVVDNDGIIRINPASNSDLAFAIWSKLHDAFDAGEDDR